MNPTKTYNIKSTDLGKVTFQDGTVFIYVGMDGMHGRLQEMIIMKDADECVKFFSTWAMQKSRENSSDPIKTHNEIVTWLIDNWLNAVEDLKMSMYEKYGFDEFRDQDPKDWLRAEPEMASLALIHVAGYFTNGYLKCPVQNIEVSIKMIKNLITVNFWEVGNPRSPEPQRK
jgi:hypothetical protein